MWRLWDWAIKKLHGGHHCWMSWPGGSLEMQLKPWDSQLTIVFKLTWKLKTCNGVNCTLILCIYFQFKISFFFNWTCKICLGKKYVYLFFLLYNLWVITLYINFTPLKHSKILQNRKRNNVILFFYFFFF